VGNRVIQRGEDGNFTTDNDVASLCVACNDKRKERDEQFLFSAVCCRPFTIHILKLWLVGIVLVVFSVVVESAVIVPIRQFKVFKWFKCRLSYSPSNREGLVISD